MNRIKRIYLVNRDLQLRYARLGVLVGAMSTLLTLLLVLYPLFHLRLLRFPNFLPSPFLVGIGLAAVLNFSAVAFLGILLSHRIAGPMFSLVRQMRAVEGGKLRSHAHVRASDDLKYMVRHFNEMVDALLARNAADQKEIEAVAALLKAPQPDVAAALGRLGALSAEMAMRGEVPAVPAVPASSRAPERLGTGEGESL